ncbi:MAG: 2-succinyl-5-enolpyruvyl-6-hydroxy-3-cyclohexene-1-carboxylic-acid synthase, partial [uncultured Solirubrobacteraceae bacterium]
AGRTHPHVVAHRRAVRRLLRAGAREDDRDARRARVHERHRGGQLRARGARGARGRRSAP